MAAYVIRRLLLMIPTLFGIILLNFLIVQVAPGGPVEQMISKLQGMNISAAGAGIRVCSRCSSR
jgi:microcin C transport system permease protein